MTTDIRSYYGKNSDIAGTKYDWGVKNIISNGGGKSWRTLTRDEWVYVFDTRNTSSGIRYAMANVNGVNGLILLPDNWSCSNYSLSNTNDTKASFNSNSISQSDWQNKFESNGAVFLPAAGIRSETNVRDFGSLGLYWSASYYGREGAYDMYFNDKYIITDGWSWRNAGHSVRLVCDVE